MFSSNRFLKRKIYLTKKSLTSICFSAQSANFVKNARTLEELKTSNSLPENALERSKCMLLVKSDLICIEENDRKLIWKDFRELSSLTFNNEKPLIILLGLKSDVEKDELYLLASDFNINSEVEIKELESKAGGKFVNTRELLFELNESDCQYALQARALTNFCRTYKFCTFCGNDLTINATGTHKHCRKCQHTHYPHVSPVGIVLIEDKRHDKVLLVRQGRHPPGMYSCIAGFIEPGETLDQSIRREVAEEVGLSLQRVEYCNSQHWAMPSSQLMLACLGTAGKEDFEIDEKEIECAQWVKADVLKEAILRGQSIKSSKEVDQEKLWVPPPHTASHQLMVEWLKRYHSFDENSQHAALE